MPILRRCSWVAESDPLYVAYHDTEWGVPAHDDQKIYEFLVLETFQAGLSWRTVLNKRENFRKAFADFEYVRVAAFTEKDVVRLIHDVGIIRNKRKIDAAITNAKQFIEVQKEFGSFDTYMWRWAGAKDGVAWAKDLKKRGFVFLGHVVVYSHMQATGMVNDHDKNCFRC